MTKNNGFRLLPIAGALLVAFNPVHAQMSDEVKALITPESSVSVGLGGVFGGDGNAQRYGVYSGLNESKAYGLLDFNFVRRNDDTGTWIIAEGRDLGLETRELGFTHQRQGDWKYALEYNEIVRHDPYTIHTGMTGIGSATPAINLTPLPATVAQRNGADTGGTAPVSDVELKIKRTAFGISAEKWLSPAWQLEASFRTEHRKGARLFGRAGLDSSDMSQRPTNTVANANGSWAILLTPEPIDSRTNIFEGKLSFNHDKLALTAGYYGSFFNNDFGALSPVVPGTLNRGALWGATAPAQSVAQLASSTVALPPDNQAHQLFLSGVYTFSKDTRANMKLAYTHATQDQSFASQGLTPATTAPSSLGGEVNTLLAMLGVSSRVTNDLTLKANLRYEDRDDKTPVYVYNTSGTLNTSGTWNGLPSNLNNTTNWPSASQTRTTAKVEGIYRLPYGYSAVLGGDWERKKSPLPIAATALFNQQVFFREQLDEYGLRGELRKALSERLNGSVALEYKERRGGDEDWKTAMGTPGPLISADPATLNRVFPDMYMNRDRTKARVSVDWTPMDPLDVQLVYEHIEDLYKRPSPVTTGGIIAGARTISTDSVSLDGSYTITENWRVSAYVTESEYRWNVNKAGILEDTRGSSQTVGLAVKGRIGSKVDVGADFLTSRDRTTFTNMVNGAAATATFLPAINYTVDRLKLFANYALTKESDIRFDAIYQHYHTDDWQWGYNGIPFLYSDNTTVSQPMTQNFGYAGARYIYKF